MKSHNNIIISYNKGVHKMLKNAEQAIQISPGWGWGKTFWKKVSWS